MPSDLQSTLNVIDQFLENPFDLGGKKASQLLTKGRRRRRRRSPSPDSDDDVGAFDYGNKSKRKEKKEKEKEQYKSAQFIEDSDAEYGDIEEFLEKEKALREKTALVAEGRGTMKPTGTRKRRRKATDGGAGKKKRKGHDDSGLLHPDTWKDTDDTNQSEGSELEMLGSRQHSPTTTAIPLSESEQQRTKPRPRPKSRFKTRSSNISASSEPSKLIGIDGNSSGESAHTPHRGVPVNPSIEAENPGIPSVGPARRRKSRLVISDDE